MKKTRINRKFLGKIAKIKGSKTEVVLTYNNEYYRNNTFNNYELLEPTDGSRVIGVKIGGEV